MGIVISSTKQDFDFIFYQTDMSNKIKLCRYGKSY